MSSHTDPSPDDREQLAQELIQNRRELEAVRRVTDALYAKTDVEELIQEALRTAVETVDTEAGSVILHDPRSDRLVFRHVMPEGQEELLGVELEPTTGIAGAVFQSGEARIVDEVAKASDHYKGVDARIGFVTRSLLSVPLRAPRQRILGVVQLCNKRSGRFTEQDTNLLTVICAQAAFALEAARLYEEARLASLMKMIGDVSHDIKNMITPLTLGASTLDAMLEHSLLQTYALLSEEGSIPPQARESLKAAWQPVAEFRTEAMEMIEDGAGAIQERVREIADCVKGVVTPPRFTRCDVQEVLSKVVQMLKPVADRGQVSLVLEPAAPPPLRADPHRLYNAFYNLVNNALPETPAGGRVALRTRVEDGRVLVDVADTGRGIPEEVARRMFTDEAFSTKPGGTGLGTRIVKSVVDAHGGTISLQTQVGRGTTITVALPLATPDAAD